MTRPTEFPEWATDPYVDPVVGGSNKVDPPPQQKQTGYLRKQKPPANYTNWLFNKINEWLVYLDGATTGGWETGDVKATYRKPTDPNMDGIWVIMNDGTIGRGSSAATTRANDDTINLFTLLWDNVADTYCPVSGGRGASAAADFAADKVLTLPASLGRAMCNVGGTPTAFVLGQSAGEQAHQLTIPELAEHKHIVGQAQEEANYGRSTVKTAPPWRNTSQIGSDEFLNFTSDTGEDTAHNTIQQSSFLNVYIKL